jgi:hypothetical protein
MRSIQHRKLQRAAFSVSHGAWNGTREHCAKSKAEVMATMSNAAACSAKRTSPLRANHRGVSMPHCAPRAAAVGSRLRLRLAWPAMAAPLFSPSPDSIGTVAALSLG